MLKISGYSKFPQDFMRDTDYEMDHQLDTSSLDLEPHYHEFYEIQYFISGTQRSTVGDKVYHLQTDDLLIIPPNVMHNPMFSDFRVPYERYVTWVTRPALQALYPSIRNWKLLLKKSIPSGTCCASLPC